MNSTILYFLLSFKKNEYKKIKIEVSLVNGKRFEKEKLTNICEINYINDYRIKIGIFDFKNIKSENYIGFHIVITNNNVEYWTEQKQFISLSNNFIFDCIFHKSYSKKYQNPLNHII